MEKKTISVQAFTIHSYTIAIALLIVALFVLGIKYVHLKLSLHNFMESTMLMNQQQMQQPVSSVNDYATVVATTIAGYPQTIPLYTQPDILQNYVTTLSKELKRDIVVVDKSQKVLADTIATNNGSTYTYDKEDEVGLTIKDGIARSFLEKSPDYPNGISEVVVAMKNANGDTLGAVIVSNFQVAQ